MFKESITPQDVCDLLNELVVLDKTAMGTILINVVPCNQALADHPTVQVAARYDGYTLGPLGILNGLFGVNENLYGCIFYKLDPENWDIEFYVDFDGGEKATNDV